MYIYAVGWLVGQWLVGGWLVEEEGEGRKKIKWLVSGWLVVGWWLVGWWFVG